MKKWIVLLFVIILSYSAGYSRSFPDDDDSDRYWRITSRRSIVWDVVHEGRLPHSDHMEMAGQKVAAIITYTVDDKKALSIRREILFPQLRTLIKTTDPDWKMYRAYFRHTYTDEILPVISLQGKTLVPGPVDSVEINGKIIIYHRPVNNIRITRTLLPSMTERLFAEHWELKNTGTEQLRLFVGNILIDRQEEGLKGNYTHKVYCEGSGESRLAPGQSRLWLCSRGSGCAGWKHRRLRVVHVAGRPLALPGPFTRISVSLSFR